MGGGQAFNGGIVQPGGQAGAGVRAERGEGAEYGHAHLQRMLMSSHYLEILVTRQLSFWRKYG